MSFDCFYVVDRGRIAKIVEYTKTWNMAKSYLSLDGVCARVCVYVYVCLMLGSMANSKLLTSDWK